MKAQQFAISITRHVIDLAIEDYRRMFSELKVEDARYEYGKKVALLFEKLTDEEKDVFFGILRQTGVDTVSAMLSIIDGVGFMDKWQGDFTLHYDGDLISGDLQEYFLAFNE